jgi:hypothetical protein
MTRSDHAPAGRLDLLDDLSDVLVQVSERATGGRVNLDRALK